MDTGKPPRGAGDLGRNRRRGSSAATCLARMATNNPLAGNLHRLDGRYQACLQQAAVLPA